MYVKKVFNVYVSTQAGKLPERERAWPVRVRAPELVWGFFLCPVRVFYQILCAQAEKLPVLVWSTLF